MNKEYYLKIDGDVRKFIETDTTISLVLDTGIDPTPLLKGGIPSFWHCPINCKEDLIVALSRTFDVEEM